MNWPQRAYMAQSLDDFKEHTVPKDKVHSAISCSWITRFQQVLMWSKLALIITQFNQVNWGGPSFIFLFCVSQMNNNMNPLLNPT